MTVELQKEGKERLAAPVAASADPTATPPAFQFHPDKTTRPGSASWVEGLWAGATAAITPTLGGTDSGADIELASGRQYPWIKIVAAGEVIVRQLKPITMRG